MGDIRLDGTAFMSLRHSVATSSTRGVKSKGCHLLGKAAALAASGMAGAPFALSRKAGYWSRQAKQSFSSAAGAMARTLPRSPVRREREAEPQCDGKVQAHGIDARSSAFETPLCTSVVCKERRLREAVAIPDQNVLS